MGALPEPSALRRPFSAAHAPYQEKVRVINRTGMVRLGFPRRCGTKIASDRTFSFTLGQSRLMPFGGCPGKASQTRLPSFSVRPRRPAPAYRVRDRQRRTASVSGASKPARRRDTAATAIAREHTAAQTAPVAPT